MRRLTFLVLILAGIYAGYWFVGARTVENTAQSALSDLTAQGWDISTTTVNTRGFPSRFDTTFQDIDLTTPDGVLRYQTPFAQVFALSYQPNRVILAMAPTQELTVAGQRLTLETDGLKASAAVAANANLSFDALTAEAARIAFSSELGFSVTAHKFLLASRPAGPAARTYDAYLSLADIQLPGGAADQQPIALMSLDTEMLLDRDLDRHLIGALLPRIEQIDVKEWALDWAGSNLRGTGILEVAADGTLMGELALKITNHAALVAQLAHVGAVDPGVAPTWVTMGDAMAAGAPVLELPLTFQNGFMSLGPFPMGPAPRLR